jgi:hypothetical protein
LFHYLCFCRRCLAIFVSGDDPKFSVLVWSNVVGDGIWPLSDPFAIISLLEE